MSESSVSDHARALSELGASKGGRARAEKLSAEERKSIARLAARARWRLDTPLATHEGELDFAGMSISCAVLEDGTRVLSERGVTKGFGLKRAGSNWQRDNEGGARLPVFASANNLKPFISNDLMEALKSPIMYRSPSAKGSVAHGVEANLIPKVCEVWLLARDAGVLKTQQAHIAVQADLIMRGLARVGIAALVDEATGYQYDRSRRALEEILESFIKDQLGRWAKRFPDEFYAELFRLKGLKWPSQKNPPQYVGHWTNNLVYKRLAPGVLDELRSKTPKTWRGHRKNKFHQWLTDDVGHPKLQEHMSALIALMKSSNDWDDFESRLNRALPKFKPLPLLEVQDAH